MYKYRYSLSGDNDYLKGVDVSHHQPPIDWSKMVAQGVSVAYVRVTRGASVVDSLWKEHHAGARNAGILVGPYHFFENKYAGVAQAANFLGQCEQVEWDLPLAGDFEDRNDIEDKALIEERILSFLKNSRSQAVYTSPAWWGEIIGGTVWARDYLLWVANWGVKYPLLPIGWKEWWMWQHTVLPSGQATEYGVARAGLDLNWVKSSTVMQIQSAAKSLHSHAHYMTPSYV